MSLPSDPTFKAIYPGTLGKVVHIRVRAGEGEQIQDIQELPPFYLRLRERLLLTVMEDGRVGIEVFNPDLAGGQ